MQVNCWGPPLWVGLHSIAANYPVRPTAAQKRQYMTFFRALQHVLPCMYCRDSYAKFIAKGGKAPLSQRAMKDRESFSRWLYNLHNAVNDRLRVTKRPSFETVRRRYERFRAQTCSDSDKVKSAPSKSAAHRCLGKKGLRRRVKILVTKCT